MMKRDLRFSRRRLLKSIGAGAALLPLLRSDRTDAACYADGIKRLYIRKRCTTPHCTMIDPVRGRGGNLSACQWAGGRQRRRLERGDLECRERSRQLFGPEPATRRLPMLGRELEISVSRPVRQDAEDLFQVGERVEAMKAT